MMKLREEEQEQERGRYCLVERRDNEGFYAKPSG